MTLAQQGLGRSAQERFVFLQGLHHGVHMARICAEEHGGQRGQINAIQMLEDAINHQLRNALWDAKAGKVGQSQRQRDDIEVRAKNGSY